MNKAILYASLLIALFTVSCHKEQVNQSKLLIEKEKAFEILSIHQSFDNQILCVGNNYGDEDSIVIRRYSRDLRLLETMYPSRIPEFGKFLDKGYYSSFQCVSMEDGRWMIGGFNNNHDLTIFITDNHLNVLKKKTITSTANVNDVSFYELKPLSNGGLAVTYDADRVSYIEIFNSELESVYKFRFAIFFTNWVSNLNTIELENGNLFYAACVWSSAKPYHRMVYGLLEANGKSIYQKINPKDYYDWLSTIGLSKAGNEILFNTRKADNNIYQLINPSNGLVTKEFELNNVSNPNNPLPSVIENNSGQFMYSNYSSQLNFYAIDQDLNIDEKFNVLFPDFPKYNAIRQLFTKEGTIIVGASIENKETSDFILQELTMEGKVVI